MARLQPRSLAARQLLGSVRPGPAAALPDTSCVVPQVEICAASAFRKQIVPAIDISAATSGVSTCGWASACQGPDSAKPRWVPIPIAGRAQSHSPLRPRRIVDEGMMGRREGAGRCSTAPARFCVSPLRGRAIPGAWRRGAIELAIWPALHASRYHPSRPKPCHVLIDNRSEPDGDGGNDYVAMLFRPCRPAGESCRRRST
jgi:hypothetical protein